MPSFILISPEVSPNVFFQQGQALRRESKEVILLMTSLSKETFHAVRYEMMREDYRGSGSSGQ